MALVNYWHATQMSANSQKHGPTAITQPFLISLWIWKQFERNVPHILNFTISPVT